ncbi:FlhC family transcriptional regulator [[Empedobacter] haloabium]|uniref:FlhC family transcriptional regulator n=2 Tax=Telluria group TaxID=2895353 RepID=A0ABZ1URV3_9BURK
MARPYVERHIHALSLAHACVQLGARMRTISYITGLTHTELAKLYPSGERVFKCGRLPASADWLIDKTNVLVRAELSIFAAIFCRLIDSDFGLSDAVVAGYKMYANMCAGPSRISFDRAFDVACHLKGIWAHPTASIALYPCPQCHSLYLSSIGNLSAASDGCVFCRLLARYDRDPRIQAMFPCRRVPVRSRHSVCALAHVKADT